MPKRCRHRYNATNGTPYPYGATGLPTPTWNPYSFGAQPAATPTTTPSGWALNPFPNTPAPSYPAFIPLLNPFAPPQGYGYTPWPSGAPTTQPQPHLNYTAYPPTPDGITPGGFFTGGGGGGGQVGLNTGWNLGPNPPKKHNKGTSGTMKRTVSDQPPHLNKDGLHRSKSWGGGGSGGAANPFGAAGFGYNAWGIPPDTALPYTGSGEYGPKDLHRRPKDWRPDFNPKGIAGMIGAFIGKGGDGSEFNDTKYRTLHPLLEYKPGNIPIDHDLRENPFEHPCTVFANLGREPNQIDFAQLTTQDACPMMRLVHPDLPWYIDVKQTHPNGVTVYDVFFQVHTQLSRQIRERDFWNEALSNKERAKITQAWWLRCNGDITSQEYARGICAVDFLGTNCVFEGLERRKKGMWEMKCSRLLP